MLKKIEKASVVKDKQIEHLKSEKSVWLDPEIKRDFISTWYDTFQDESHLYFVLEFIPGSDLHSLSKKGILSTLQKVKFYFAEILLAIGRSNLISSVMILEELHRHDIVYRDLKLDNIMVAADGHIKVTWTIQLNLTFP